MNSLLADEPIVELSPDDVTLTEAGILVVDEDPAFQLGLKTFLKEFVGFEKVFTARNGREAIDLIEQEKCIELLTLDYQMPEMDGLELLTRLQDETPRPLAVTMITGFPSEDLKKEFASRTTSKLLTNHFLAKPVEFEKLEPVILEAYEDLKASQRLTETMTGEYSETFPVDPGALALEESHRALLMRLDSFEERLDENTRVLHDLTKSRMLKFFWFDILKMLLVAFFLFMVWHLGWAEKLKNQLSAGPETVEVQELPEGPGEPQPIIDVPLDAADSFVEGVPLEPVLEPEPEPQIKAASPVVLDSNGAAARKREKRSEPLPFRDPFE